MDFRGPILELAKIIIFRQIFALFLATVSLIFICFWPNLQLAWQLTIPIGQKKNFSKKLKIDHFMAEKRKKIPKKSDLKKKSKKIIQKVYNIPYLSYKDIWISPKSRSQEIITAQASIKNGPFLN